MTTRTKLTALAAALALPLAAPALAGEKSDDIVVSSKAAMEQWQADTTADINRTLARDPTSRKTPPNNAVVEVAFTLGADGRAENIEILDGYGNWSARRAAKYAVRALDTLGDVPVRDRTGTAFLAQIIFADNEEIHAKLTKKAAKARAARFAAMEENERPILLGG